VPISKKKKKGKDEGSDGGSPSEEQESRPPRFPLQASAQRIGILAKRIQRLK
jgi:hypothetical protein